MKEVELKIEIGCNAQKDAYKGSSITVTEKVLVTGETNTFKELSAQELKTEVVLQIARVRDRAIELLAPIIEKEALRALKVEEEGKTQ